MQKVISDPYFDPIFIGVIYMLNIYANYRLTLDNRMPILYNGNIQENVETNF
tara:strand:+ start:126 stop:281 length:156 start_codon:yes stop_codon:yes gene_type:complete